MDHSILSLDSTMSRTDWELENAGLRAQEAPIIPAHSADESQVPARKPTSARPSTTLDLKFVNLSHPDDVRRKKAVRTEIRRHVMKDIGERRRRPRCKDTFPQNTSTSSELNNRGVSLLYGTTTSTVSPSRGLASLGDFPVNADMRVLELMHTRKSLIISADSLFASANHVCFLLVNAAPYQAFRNIWITTALRDSGAFHVTLGNAANLLNNINGSDSHIKSPEALRHYEISTRQLRLRLNNFTESDTEGAIANILAHVCLTVCPPISTTSS
jgi:hypothetical protein